ncbi:MAG: aldo/keto reductase [Verrucomicrobia bacterium]|nr:aldo/keto reductase [Verrucomicrobiota bacterium]
MDLTRTVYGTWNGGRFMHYGEALSDERWISVVQHAYKMGVRTFMTADVYGVGAADDMLGRALAGLPRESYCLVGMIGHDFYKGQRQGSKGFPRFTDPTLRQPKEFKDYLRMATEKSLERCRTDKFDLLMLHNPDSIGYTSDAVWTAMNSLKEEKLSDRIGIAPGPANGFTLDILLNFERFGPLLDWGMIILNPFEPWPGNMILSAAEAQKVKLITRVVDYGGIFHDDVKPGHEFGAQDHRSFRPDGWVETGYEKLNQLREMAEKYNVTMLQLACLWNLTQRAVESVVPTIIQEIGAKAKSIESKVDELAQLPEIKIDEEDCERIAHIGNNKGCMELKGANPGHIGEPQPDRWGISNDHLIEAERWGVDPAKDLVCTHKAS